MAWGGRVLVVGFASGRFPRLSVNHALIKGLSILGVRAGESGRRDPAAGREDRAKIRQLLAQGVMLPPIGARFPLSAGVRALQTMAERQVVGKLCLEMP
jgi:NADPH2:quinone reductase